MSKPNRRKEIQEKEALQLKFQLALSQSQKSVLSWLPQTVSASGPETSSDKLQFMELPVIPPGAGLYEIEKEDPARSATIGQFLGEELPSPAGQPTARDNRTGSKAMSALMNRMRTDTRKAMAGDRNGGRGDTKPGGYGVQKPHRHQSKYLQDVKGPKNPSAKTETPAAAADSDDEESKSKQIQRKKNPAMQFGKAKGKKGRPF